MQQYTVFYRQGPKDPIRWKLIYLVRLWTCCACKGQRRTLERKQMYIPKDNETRQIGDCVRKG